MRASVGKARPLWKDLLYQVTPTRVWSLLRVAHIYSSIALFRSHIISGFYGGTELTLELRDPLARGWYGHNWPPLPEVDFLKLHRLRPGARVFDIGAHQGVVALMLARAVGREGSVVAVEASPHNAAMARRNRDLNDARNLLVVHGAVAEAPGRLYFNRGLNGQVDRTGGWGRVEVAAITIDDLARTYGFLTVLFIDVEGYEARVLAGASEVLRGRPDCVVEVHVNAGLEDFDGSVEQLVSYFPQTAFRLFAAPPNAEFVEFSEDLPFLGRRFFLIAIPTD